MESGADNASPSAWRCGDFLIQPAARLLLRDSVPVDVEERVFDLIVLLLRHRERALGRQEIITELWGSRPVSDATLRQLVYKARRTFGDDGTHQAVIRTLYGRSLQWVAPVIEVSVAHRDDDLDPDASQAPGQVSAEASRVPAAVQGDEAMTRATRASPMRHWRRLRGLFIAGAMGAVVFMVAMSIPRGETPAAPRAPRLVIEPLENATGDPGLDWTRNGLPGLLASLVGEGGGADVVEPLQVAKAWQYKPRHGRTREQQLRLVTGADIVVGGSLHKLGGALYSLTLRVVPKVTQDAFEIDVTGDKPSELAVDAVSRIRRGLRLERPLTVSSSLPPNSFPGEAYARGMDFLVHGQMSEARMHFALCAQENPEFLPGRLYLGVTQIYTNELDAADKTLRSLAATAQRQNDPLHTAQAFNRLGALGLARHRFAAALESAQEATPFALKSGNANVLAINAMYTAQAASGLHQVRLARRKLDEAKALIAEHHLALLKPALYGAEGFYANAIGDFVAKEQADRAALRISEATGNERNALAGSYNLAQDLMQQQRDLDAIPLLDHVYRRARASQQSSLTIYAGETLAAVLVELGADQRAEAIVDELLHMSALQHSGALHAITLSVRASVQQYRGDSSGAVVTYRKALALVDPAQSPDAAMDMLEYMAASMNRSGHAALRALLAQADTIVAANKGTTTLRYPRQLLLALVEGAIGEPAKAVTSLRAAALAPHPDDPAHNDLRAVAFVLGRDNEAAATLAMQDMDVATQRNAMVLRACARWARARGDNSLAQRAEERIAASRRTVLMALSRQDALEAAHSGMNGA